MYSNSTSDFSKIIDSNQLDIGNCLRLKPIVYEFQNNFRSSKSIVNNSDLDNQKNLFAKDITFTLPTPLNETLELSNICDYEVYLPLSRKSSIYSSIESSYIFYSFGRTVPQNTYYPINVHTGLNYILEEEDLTNVIFIFFQNTRVNYLKNVLIYKNFEFITKIENVFSLVFSSILEFESFQYYKIENNTILCYSTNLITNSTHNLIIKNQDPFHDDNIEVQKTHPVLRLICGSTFSSNLDRYKASVEFLLSEIHSNNFWYETPQWPEKVNMKLESLSSKQNQIDLYISEQFGQIEFHENNTYTVTFSTSDYQFFETIFYICLLHNNRLENKKIDLSSYINFKRHYYFPNLLNYIWDRMRSEGVDYYHPLGARIRYINNKLKDRIKIKNAKIYSSLLEAGKDAHKWTSERDLFLYIRNLYPSTIFQYQPSWLAPQSLDIFIPELSIGIEYQGIQHYEALEYFGGKAALIQNRKRDLKKAKLCRDNNVTLLEWKYTYEVNDENLEKFIEKYFPKK